MAYSAIEVDISLHECPILTYHLTLHYSGPVGSAPIITQSLMPSMHQYFSPVIMLSRMIWTWSSRSGRVCSCQKPTTCPSSCTTIPNLSQFLPIEIACGPLPRFPTNEQHLRPRKTFLMSYGFACHGEQSCSRD